MQEYIASKMVMHTLKYIRIKVAGKSHKDRKYVQLLHQNICDKHVSSPDSIGEVVVMCSDDLEKMPLNQMAYNKKRPVVEGEERTAPTYNFESSHKLTFTTFLLLTLDTQANRERKIGKRTLLKREHTAAELLPLAERQRRNAENAPDAERLTSVRFEETDRSGIPIAVIKSWAKSNKGEHLPYSQPSSSFQHAEDIVQFVHEITRMRGRGRGRVPAKYASAQALLGRDGHVTPYFILTTDGPNEQSVRWLQNVLALWCILLALNLDGIEKIHYCPGHSKDNPDEMLNRSVKDNFRGRYIKLADNSGADGMHTVKCAAAKMLATKTHAGESVLPFVSDPEHRWSEQERQQYEFTIDSYESLMEFVQERKKHADSWHTDDPPAEVVRNWATEEEAATHQFAHLEEMVQQVKHHIAFLNIYGIALRKCLPGPNMCNFCKQHPPRGAYLKNAAREFLTDLCNPTHPCAQPCTHTLDIQYGEIMSVLNNIAPDLHVPRRCGCCRALGHDVRKCPLKPISSNKRQKT